MMEYQEREAKGVLKMLAFIGGAILLAIIVINLSMAAVETTTIQGKVVIADGSSATGGRIEATLSTAGTSPDTITAASQAVGGRTIGTIGATGDVTLTLVPNDAITPSDTYYRVRITATSADNKRHTWEENWSVATAPDPVDVGAITRLDVAPGLTVGAFIQYIAAEPSGPCSTGAVPVIALDTDKLCECVAGSWSCAALGGGHTMKSAGTPLAERTALNCVGDLLCADDAGNDETDMTVTIDATRSWSTLQTFADLGLTDAAIKVSNTTIIGNVASGAFDYIYSPVNEITITQDPIAGYSDVTVRATSSFYVATSRGDFQIAEVEASGVDANGDQIRRTKLLSALSYVGSGDLQDLPNDTKVGGVMTVDGPVDLISKADPADATSPMLRTWHEGVQGIGVDNGGNLAPSVAGAQSAGTLALPLAHVTANEGRFSCLGGPSEGTGFAICFDPEEPDITRAWIIRSGGTDFIIKLETP